jgi:hypothetical protein
MRRIALVPPHGWLLLGVRELKNAATAPDIRSALGL